jgi:type I restriction enzyme S subunit
MVFADGDWIESRDQSSDGLRLIQTGNVGEGEFKDRAEKARFVSLDTFQRLRCTEVVAGDCLISRLPEPVGRACILPKTGQRMITAVDCTIARFDERRIIPEFFQYYSQSCGYLGAVEREATGTTRRRISRARLAQVHVPLPRIEEQRRIVAILDEAFEGIATAKAHAETNLRNAREVLDCHLAEIFTKRSEGWSSKAFEDCIEDVKYTNKIPRKEFLTAGAFPVISQESEFINGYWDNVSDVFKINKPLVVFGDHTQVLKYIDFDFVLGADGVKLLVPKAFLHPKFFYYALRAAPARSLGYARHYRLLKELQIGFPSIAEQVSSVDRLDKAVESVQRLGRIYAEKSDLLAALKQSLLHQAFSGRL